MNIMTLAGALAVLAVPMSVQAQGTAPAPAPHPQTPTHLSSKLATPTTTTEEKTVAKHKKVTRKVSDNPAPKSKKTPAR